ncbi:OmpA family protein [Spirosoma utsteinense]|uniref:Outer membrane protein OmpA-like peptidoglycan-associated protein/tetratricopeptide repeat protein n=1 Tax=Spirosoma utsteinense TaxID=2585773 RepID=A0ABR6VZQ9_9BACT|nr:OmpA family protein [Spirosoma utsteinense]MBC3786880.1 outer membrane protein OmpA-like peptidoglycan-associated protein/tetratricopeptide repeat protein [Spirosoma utsteinense]MBC3789824.1 outer membrane protein OmpA-like peptidoglycan-associated protein/tetratricopeptide repeat protein [Spirosoma utsteinense]
MKRIVFLFGFISLSISAVWAQSLTKQADHQFDQLAYTKAADLYEQVLTNPVSLSYPERLTIKARLGYSYQQARDTKNAERVYRELLAESDSLAKYPRYHLYYAQALASNGKYKEAQVAYARYDEMLSADNYRTVSAKLSQDVGSLTRTTGTYSVEFLNMNTEKPEFSPVLYEDGLVFVTENKRRNLFKRTKTAFLDLYYFPKANALTGATSTTGKRTQPKPIQLLGFDAYTAPTANDSRLVGSFEGVPGRAGYGGKFATATALKPFSHALNSRYHEGPATFSVDGSRVIFTRNNYNEGQYRESKDGVNKLKLFTATRTYGSWSSATELPVNSEEFSTGHPCLAKGRSGEPDQLLYFSSDRPGGFGGSDIYVSSWKNGQWDTPVNLGERVNSKGNELFPFVDEKGNLYVASDGHGGLGGLDLFYIQLNGPSQPVGKLLGLGEPLNSSKDDFGIVTDGERNKGYLSSNRKNGGADNDVYRFTREGVLHTCRELTISIIDAATREPLANTILRLDNKTDNTAEELRTNSEGLVRICLTAGSDNRFIISQDGYLTNKVGFSTKNKEDMQPSRIEILMTKPAAEAEHKIATAGSYPPPGVTNQPGVENTLTSGMAGKLVEGEVLTQTYRKPIGAARVIIVNECDGTVQETTTDVNGRYHFVIQPNCDYHLEAVKEHMGTWGSRLTKDSTGYTNLLMFKEGDIITIDNIHYDRNQSAIRPDAAAELDKVVKMMNKYPAMTIEIRAHTDSRSTAPYNQKLSGDRARSAASYLKSKGIVPGRVVARGLGESVLLNKCADGVPCSESDHQRNRRTEIKILGME